MLRRFCLAREMEQGKAIQLFVVLFLSAYSCCSNNCTATDEQQGKPQGKVTCVAGPWTSYRMLLLWYWLAFSQELQWHLR